MKAYSTLSTLDIGVSQRRVGFNSFCFNLFPRHFKVTIVEPNIFFVCMLQNIVLHCSGTIENAARHEYDGSPARGLLGKDVDEDTIQACHMFVPGG